MQGYWRLGLLLIPVSLLLLGFYSFSQSPYLGIDYAAAEEGWVISRIDENGPAGALGILPGALLLQIGDVELTRYTLLRHPHNIPRLPDLHRWRENKRRLAAQVTVGKPVHLVVAVNGKTRGFNLVSKRRPLADVLTGMAPVTLACLFWLFLGASVAVQRPADRQAQAFYWLALVLGTNFICFNGYAHYEFALNPAIYALLRGVNSVCSVLVPALFLYFALVSPKPHPLLARRDAAIALATLPLLILALYLPRIWYQGFHLYFAACFLGGLGLMVSRYRSATAAEERAQLRWILWGAGAFVLSIVLFNIVPLAFIGRSLLPDWSIPFFISLIPISMTIAISRHHFLDIDSLFDNTLIYAITLGLLAGLDAIVVVVLGRIPFEVIDVSAGTARFVGFWAALPFYLPLRERIRFLVKRGLKRNDYRIEPVLFELSQRVIATEDFQTLIDQVMRLVLRTLHPKRLVFVFQDEHGRRYSDNGQDPALYDILLKQAGALTGASYLRDFESSLDAAEFRQLRGHFSDGILAPVSNNAGVVGAIYVNDKQSLQLYNDKDLHFMALVVAQLISGLERILTRERIEQERERIYSDLHDDVGAKLLSLVYRAGNAENAALARSALQDLRDVVSTPVAQTACLDALIADLQAECGERTAATGIALHWHNATPIPEVTVDNRWRVHLARTMREAISNIIRHADTKAIDLTIAVNDNRLRINVQHDGTSSPVSSWRRGRGMRNMERRVGEIGGHIDWRDMAGKVAGLTIDLPLP